MNNCLFCNIINGVIPSAKLYEDGKIVSFLDIRPTNPGHALVVPKEHSRNLLDMAAEDVRAVFLAAQRIANAVMKGVEAEGINITMNNEPAAGQVVFHSHVHIIPRFSSDGYRHWQGGPYQDGQMEEVRKRIVLAMGK